MTHVVLGYPNMEFTRQLVQTLVMSGADMIELQIPFSDPLADGITIMNACESSLENGFTVEKGFSLIQELGREVSVPLYLMAYFNTVFQYGVEKFCRRASLVGVRGLIIPDMPIEEENHEKLVYFCKKYHLENIRVVSPASTDARLRLNAEVGTGFVYATAKQGITGASKNLPTAIQDYVSRVKKHFSIPLAVGFGICKAEHIHLLSKVADIAIVGSAIIDVINSSEEKNLLKKVADFIAGLKMVK